MSEKPKLTLPLEVGKRYVLRNGDVVKIQENRRDNAYHFVANGAAYTANGRYYNDHVSNVLDIVADYIEPVKSNAHPHAANMMLYAQDAAETDVPWERWQTCRIGRDEWINLDGPAHWSLQHAYRRKPKTIRIGKHDIHPDDLIAARKQIEAVFEEQK